MESGTENEKQKFVFLGWQMINDNLHLLFQQMCPSMDISFLRRLVGGPNMKRLA